MKANKKYINIKAEVENVQIKVQVESYTQTI